MDRRDLWITSRSRALHCVAVGEGPPVVFVHGIGGSAATFSSFAPRADFLSALADEGFTVFALDLQGHGLSEGRRGHVPFDAALANIGEMVAFAAERGGERIGLCGSGLGGMLALYAGMADARVGAVVCHTAADLRSIAGFEPRARRRALAWLAGRARKASAVAPLVRLPVRALFPLDDFFEDPANVMRWKRFPRAVRWYTLETLVSLFLTPDDKPAVEAMAKPVLVLTGEEDRVVPLAGQEDLVSRLPEGELSVVAGAGHMVPLEHCAEAASRIGGWLRKVL